MIKKLSLLTLFLPTVLSAQLPSGATPIQGTGDPNRGAPINAQIVTCSGNPVTCAPGGGGGVAQGVVVSGDQAYTVGSNPALNMTATGRLKVGLSSAGNVAPAGQPATQTTADLTACKYVAAGVTFADGNTGALTCDTTGALRTSVAGIYKAGAVTAVSANAKVDASADSFGNLRGRIVTDVVAGSDGASNSNVGLANYGGNLATVTWLGTMGWVYNRTNASWDRMTGDATGGLWAQGASASGTAVAGNPVGARGTYLSTLPTLTTGQGSELLLTPKGTLLTTIADNGGNFFSSFANNADASGVTSATVGKLGVVSFGYLFDGSTWNRQRGDTTGAWVGGHGSMATGQISVATSSTLLVAARTGRQKVIISVGAANTCAFGNSGVTTTTGFPLQPVAGASITLDTSSAIYAACSATTTVSYLEQF